MISFRWFSSNIFGGRDQKNGINVPHAEIHDVETGHGKQARTLKHLLRLNHVNHSVIYNNLYFHNHMPHILGSAYIYNASPEHLNAIYDKESKHLEPWTDPPGEVSRHDWQDYLGKREYQRGYLDFFEDELVRYGYDWKELTLDYLFNEEPKLINNVASGLFHPLIHLGYAFELSNQTLAMEGLTLTASFWNPSTAKYLSDPSYTRPSERSTSSLLEIVKWVHEDQALNHYQSPGSEDIEALMRGRDEARILEYWNSWTVTDPTKQFEESQHLAVLLLVGTHEPGTTHFDFFIVHLLTSSHAVRILLPLIPAKFHVPLVRQWWLFVLMAYISQARPVVNEEPITNYDPGDKDWQWVRKRAVGSDSSLDAHYVKALRAMDSAASTWSDPDSWYLKAAVRFATEFESWAFSE